MKQLLTLISTLSIALGAKSDYLGSSEYGPYIQQQPRPRTDDCSAGIYTFSPTCRQQGLAPANLTDWSAMNSVYETMSKCKMRAARMMCDRRECSVIIIEQYVANIISGVPRALCRRMAELCEQQSPQPQQTQATPSAVPTGCPVSLPSACSPANSTFAILNATVPFSQSRALCSRLGMKVADVTISNFVSAVDSVLQCLGPRQKAWVASWNGDTYGNRTCLALTVGDQRGGGAINPSGDCSEPLPVLCEKTAESTTYQSGPYAVLTNVTAQEAVSACQSINMTLASVTAENKPAIARLNCPLISTFWVSSFQSSRSSRPLTAEECGCLGITLLGRGRIGAVRPLFECQCQEPRAALCMRPSDSSSASPSPSTSARLDSITTEYARSSVDSTRPTGYATTLA